MAGERGMKIENPTLRWCSLLIALAIFLYSGGIIVWAFDLFFFRGSEVFFLEHNFGAPMGQGLGAFLLILFPISSILIIKIWKSNRNLPKKHQKRILELRELIYQIKRTTNDAKLISDLTKELTVLENL